MLPQSCSDVHYSLSFEVLDNKIRNDSNKNKNKFLLNNICCFDYLINIEEYYRDNMNQICFYKKFIKLIYEFDKQNILDFPNYNKDSLVKFIIILNKVSCYYYIHKKIKYSKYICNLTVKICQILFQSNNNNIITYNQYEKNGQILNELKNNNIISNIYNNACCNYLKTFSFNKCLKFLEYSCKNIEENDINNKLIYYNNSLIISTKIIFNHDKINETITIIEQLIQKRKNYFNSIYCENNNGDDSNRINIKLRENEDNYKDFKLLCFIIYNYILFIENIFKRKEQAKNLYRINYEYVSKYLGKDSFEAQKFLIRLKDEIKNKNLNFKFDDGNKIFDKEGDNIKLRINHNRNQKHSDNDINKRLNNIIEKIEEFESILQNEKILNIINEKNNKEKISSNDNEIQKENINNEMNIQLNNNFIQNDKIKINEKDFKENQIEIKKEDEKNVNLNKKEKEKEIITFDMMDNIIEEFKKESQKKLEDNKKLKEEKEKEKKIEENKNIQIKIKNSENTTDIISPKKVPRIKKLFQKVLGKTQKEEKKTKLGELFESLMENNKEQKNESVKIYEEKKDEIKVEKEKEDNFINLDEEEDDVKEKDEIINNKDNNKKNKNEINNNKKDQSLGYGFTIKVNLDPSSYSYDATTLYQENEI